VDIVSHLEGTKPHYEVERARELYALLVLLRLISLLHLGPGAPGLSTSSETVYKAESQTKNNEHSSANSGVLSLCTLSAILLNSLVRRSAFVKWLAKPDMDGGEGEKISRKGLFIISLFREQ
jgi:hypothetical protein